MPPHTKIGIKLTSTVAPYVKRVYEKLSTDALDSGSDKVCVDFQLW